LQEEKNFIYERRDIRRRSSIKTKLPSFLQNLLKMWRSYESEDSIAWGCKTKLEPATITGYSAHIAVYMNFTWEVFFCWNDKILIQQIFGDNKEEKERVALTSTTKRKESDTCDSTNIKEEAFIQRAKLLKFITKLH
jgi:hypothetical protein